MGHAMWKQVPGLALSLGPCPRIRFPFQLAGSVFMCVACIYITSSLPLFHLSLKTTTERRQSEDPYPHFTDKKTEAQRGEMTYPAV